MAFLSCKSFASLSQTFAISFDIGTGNENLLCLGTTKKSSLTSSDTLSKTHTSSVIVSQILANFKKRPPTLSDTWAWHMISLRIEGGTETYLSPPHIQDLAPDGCPLPTTGKCAGSPFLGQSTRVDWSGCAVTFFPPALALARVADVLASVAS